MSEKYFLNEDRRRQIAYLYLKYCYRYDGLLNVNHPKGIGTSTRYAAVSLSEAWVWEQILDALDQEIGAENFAEFHREDPTVRTQHGRVALAFVEKMIEKVECTLDEDLIKHLLRFADHAEIAGKDVLAFFKPLLENRLSKLLFSVDWDTHRVWP